MRKGITDEDYYYIFGGALEKRSESALGLVGQGFCFIKDNDFGWGFSCVKEKALHAAFHERIDFLANDFQTSLIAAIQKQETGEFVEILSVEGDGETLCGGRLSRTRRTEKQHMGACLRRGNHCFQNIGQLVF